MIYSFSTLLTGCRCVCVSNVVVSLKKGHVRRTALRMQWCIRCVFFWQIFFPAIAWLVSGAETHPFYAVQTVQNSPHREQRKEFSLTNDVSVWRGWVWWWWWGGVTWVWENKSLCGGGNMRSPTEMLNSFTDWKREKRTLYKDEEKRSPFNLFAI